MSLDNNQETFVYEDPDHNNYLLEKLNTLRKSKQFCDVILQIGTPQDVHEIYAHRAILASVSRYFLDIFTNNNTDCGIPQIQLYKLLSNKYDVDAFNRILDYIYTSRLEIPKKNVRNVYALAVRLKMNSVAKKCSEFLETTLTPDSCLNVRATNGVLNDPLLLNSVDNYIKEKIGDVIKSKFVEKLDKIKIEVLQNSDEESDRVNPRHLFNMISDWIRKEFDDNSLNSEQLLMKTYMLYLKDRGLHDCYEINNGDHNYSEVIHEYKSLSRKLSAKRSSENVNLSNNQLNKDGSSNDSLNNLSESTIKDNSSQLKDEIVLNSIKSNNKNKAPSKPKQFLFTRSDSDSSLSSIADDDENDWKVLGIETSNKNNLNGLVMIAGKLYLLNAKLKVHSPHTTRNNSLEKPEIYSTVSNMNVARCALGAACLKGQLVVAGGNDKSGVLKSVEVYDNKTNKWSFLEPMKIARARFGITVLDNKIYAIAGSDGNKELSSAEVYENGSWKFISKCPIERSNAGVCSLDGKIYIIGGWNNQNSLQRCDVYDPKTNEYTRIADLKIGRYQVAVAVLNGCIYAVGGCNYTCCNSVECYNPADDTWTTVEPMHQARRGCGVAVLNGCIYAVGGHDGIYSLASVEIYNPKEGSWSKGPNLQVCRANVGVSVVNDSDGYETIWVAGGFSGKVFLQTVEYLDPKNNEWTAFLKKDVNGNLKLVKDRTGDELNSDLNKLKIKDDERKENIKQEMTNGKKTNSKEPLVEVEGENIEKMSETN